MMYYFEKDTGTLKKSAEKHPLFFNTVLLK